MLRERNSDATRADLLRAASQRFTMLGYERTTTRDVAADVGVNVSLINRYFGSKDGLFAAVLARSANMVEHLRELHPEGILHAIVDALDLAVDDDADEHPLLLLLRTEVGADTDGEAGVGELRRRALGGVLHYLAEQIERGGVADATLRAEMVLALVAGVATMRTSLPSGALASADAEGVRRLVMVVAGRPDPDRPAGT